MEPIIPTLVTPQQAAEALGLTSKELAQNLTDATAERLRKLARRIESFDLSDLAGFDEDVEGARRMFESTIACWAAHEAAVSE